MINTLTLRRMATSLGVFAAFGILPFQTTARPLERHFGSEDSCYARTYSDAHLEAHPQQRIREIKFGHFPTTFGTQNDDGTVQFDPATAQLHFLISAKFRDSDLTYTNGGVCNPDGAGYKCSIECDGGSFYLDDRSPDSVRLRNPVGFWIAGCGNAEMRFLDPEPDDKVFRLDRLSQSACRP